MIRVLLCILLIGIIFKNKDEGIFDAFLRVSIVVSTSLIILILMLLLLEILI